VEKKLCRRNVRDIPKKEDHAITELKVKVRAVGRLKYGQEGEELTELCRSGLKDTV